MSQTTSSSSDSQVVCLGFQFCDYCKVGIRYLLLSRGLRWSPSVMFYQQYQHHHQHKSNRAGDDCSTRYQPCLLNYNVRTTSTDANPDSANLIITSTQTSKSDQNCQTVLKCTQNKQISRFVWTKYLKCEQNCCKILTAPSPSDEPCSLLNFSMGL